MTTSKPYSISTPADILSYIPHALGYWPRESLVFLTMTEKSVGATLRVDLPQEDAAGNQAPVFAEQVRNYLSGDSAADSTLVALYTEAEYSGPANPPHGHLMAVLGTTLASSGTPIRDAWLVSDAGWRDYFCDDIDCCPWPGRAVEEIISSELNAELIFRGSQYGRSPEHATGISPAMQPAANPAVNEAIRTFTCGLENSWLDEDQFLSTLAAWRNVLEARGREAPSRTSGQLPQGVPDEESVGFLLASLECRTLRDCLLVLLSVGSLAAASGASSFGALTKGDGAVTMPDALWNNPGGAAGSWCADAGAIETAAAAFESALVGRHQGTPDWDSINNAFELFRELLGFSQGSSTSALLTMLAWIEWNRGRGSQAKTYLDKCLEIDPGYKLACLLSQLLGEGHLSAWAMHPESAWRMDNSQAA